MTHRARYVNCEAGRNITRSFLHRPPPFDLSKTTYATENSAHRPNTIITPHIGSRTFETVVRQATMATQNLINFVESRPPLAQMNREPEKLTHVNVSGSQKTESLYVVSPAEHNALVRAAYMHRGYTESEADAATSFCEMAATHGIRTHNAIKALHLDHLFGSQAGGCVPGAEIEKRPCRFEGAEIRDAKLKPGQSVAFDATQRCMELADKYGIGQVGYPIVIDWATSTVAMGRVQQYRRENRALPEDAALDANGNPTTDPNRAVSLLPLGAHKEYGLSLINEIMAALAGGSLPTLRGRKVPTGEKSSTNFYFQVIHPEAMSAGMFAGDRSQAENVRRVLEDIRSHGKTAIVIGGTGELCGSIAETMASSGAEVVLVGRSEEKANARIESIRKAGGSGYFVAADVASRDSIEALLATILEKSGRCDVLVNGAGINSATPFLDVPEEEFDRIFATNTKAVFLACQVFGRYFLDNDIKASIVNVRSMSGMIPLSRVFTYSMTKAAVHNISKNLAREWATRGIRVNTLVPGFFPADQNRKVLTPDRVEQIMAHTPMNRFDNAVLVRRGTVQTNATETGQLHSRNPGSNPKNGAR